MTALVSSVVVNGLDTPIQGLKATLTAPLPFLKGVVIRSFILERAQESVFIYNSPGIVDAAGDILASRRPTRLLVNHWHEAMFDMPNTALPSFVGEADRGRVKGPVAGTFRSREMVAENLEAIPTPGHTPGTTAFVWDNGVHRLLFPGDTIWVEGGEWKAVLLAEEDRAAYIASLSLLASVAFDILVPWGCREREAYAYFVSRDEARTRIQRIIERLQSGEYA